MRNGTVFGLLLLVLGAASCAQILGDDFQVDEDEVDDDGSSSSSSCDGSGDCGSCLDCACASEVANCDADFDCSSLATCIGNCSSTEECDGCYASYPGGISGVEALLNCGYAECPSDCSGA